MVNIVFFGSSEHSVVILQKLITITDFSLVAVVSKQDKPVGREQIITPNPVAKFCKENELNLLQPAEFDSDFIKKFTDLKPDLALVVAYGPPYFTQEMIDIPTYKVVNIHPSPLPKYRGATPGPWQIINGETSTAISFFQIDALPDHGPVIAQLPFSIDSTETASSFYQKAFKIAANNLESVLKQYIDNPQNITTQDHTQRTYFPKFSKDNAKIDWTWEPAKIERFIRALNPWPIAWTYVKNQQHDILKMKIFSATLTGNNLTPKDIQIEGKKAASWEEIKKYYEILKN